MTNKKQANFYKIAYIDFPKVFPKLMEAILGGGNRVMVLVREDNQVDYIDNLLWTYSQLSFLPHLTHKDELCEESPIYITNSEADNANQSNIIVILSEGYDISSLKKFEKYIFFYDDSKVDWVKNTVEKFGDKVDATYIMQDKVGKWMRSSNI